MGLGPPSGFHHSIRCSGRSGRAVQLHQDISSDVERPLHGKSAADRFTAFRRVRAGTRRGKTHAALSGDCKSSEKKNSTWYATSRSPQPSGLPPSPRRSAAVRTSRFGMHNWSASFRRLMEVGVSPRKPRSRRREFSLDVRRSLLGFSACRPTPRSRHYGC